jgi:hypothetical protein
MWIITYHMIKIEHNIPNIIITYIMSFVYNGIEVQLHKLYHIVTIIQRYTICLQLYKHIIRLQLYNMYRIVKYII